MGTNDSVKDLVIIGAGPAGLSAAIYAQRSLLDCVVLEQEAIGGQVVTTSEVDNYPGVPHADGFGLVEAMSGQAKDLGADICSVSAMGLRYDAQSSLYEVEASDGSIRARTVILAGGATPRHAGFRGEEGFVGHGVSYCATCDGMFYRNKHVYVIGGGNSACEEALFLTKFARQVDVVVRKDHLRAQAAVARELEEHPKVRIRYLTSIVAAEGAQLIEKVILRDNATGAEYAETYEAGDVGIFVFVGRVPAASIAQDLVETDEQGYVITDDRMATRTPGLFAAGDIRRKPLRQIVTAAADGAIAATSAAAFLGHPVEG
jgi:thioredoxin reductase (NADPH)